MEKKLKDYLYLYLGCNYARLDDGELVDQGTMTINELYKYYGNFLIGTRYRPILRPLSSMTSAEEDKAMNQWYSTDGDTFKQDAAKVKYLLDNHFDLFGLIEAGLAIDATTLKATETPDMKISGA